MNGYFKENRWYHIIEKHEENKIIVIQWRNDSVKKLLNIELNSNEIYMNCFCQENQIFEEMKAFIHIKNRVSYHQ